jgi:lipopolysaccharide/colanic/teichoic acid biosynthesis glycosyltransferase
MKRHGSLGVRVTGVGVQTLDARDATLRDAYWYDLRTRRPFAAFAKRLLDITGALLVLTLTAPLMLVIVLLRRNAIVVQRSVGLRGVTFDRYLFRGRFAALPQFFNVIEGSMSLVGPRPASIDEGRDTHMRRFTVRPGITSLSDVRDGDAMRLDREYVNDWSVGLDVKILTAAAVRALRRTARATRDL